MLQSHPRFHDSVAACSGADTDENVTGLAACEDVVGAWCERMYACYSTAELTSGFGLPATKSECDAMYSAHCDDAEPAPGMCKGHAQTSPETSSACADEFAARTCDELKTLAPSATCKMLCASTP